MFLMIRTEFARTFAASSAYGYILGLGDRHLDNILLDTRSGSVIHIDFGICFGMGASHLPVPELIPFRMTPQLITALRPLDETGLFRQYMIKVMQRLESYESAKALENAFGLYFISCF